jgi:hypothetical protein
MNSRAQLFSLLAGLGLITGVALQPSVAAAQGFNLGVELNLTADTLPTSVAVGDLNGDGKPDLVTVNNNSGSSTVSVWLGTGGGGYGPKATYTTSNVSSNSSIVVIGDMNGDGKPDLVVADSNQDSIMVMLGNGLGSFGPRAGFWAGPLNYLQALTLADVNGDGKLDAITGNTAYNDVVVMLGNGAGGLGYPYAYYIGAQPNSVVAADVNNDGKMDLVVSEYSSNQISVLLGDNSGNFYTHSEYSTGSGPTTMAVGDLNNDGKLDIITANYNGGGFSVMLGNGTGGFTYWAEYVLSSTIFAVAIGDLNGDGKPDLALANFGASVITTMIGDGTGSFGSRVDIATGYNPADVTIVDVNGDGRPDIVGAIRNAGQVAVLLNNGTGITGARGDLAAGSHPEGVAMGDLNGDGKPDLIVANTSSGTISALLGNGAGGFSPKIDYAVGTGPVGVAIADMNLDGMPDVVVANYGSNTVQVMVGNGGGGFQLLSSALTGTGPNAVAVGDLNGDGKPDVVTPNYGTNTVSVLLNTGSGGLGAKTDYTVGTNPTSVALADVNGDGKLDLIVANYGSSTGSVLINNGGGTFAPKVDFYPPSGPSRVAVGDMNGDGWPDIVVSSQTANAVSVFTGNGTANYNSYYSASTGTQPTSVAIGDFNSDGRPDLVVTNYGSATVSMLLGNGTGGIGSKIDLPAGTNPISAAAGDLNGDGRADIAAVNYGSNTASVWLSLELTRITLVANPTAVLNTPTQITANIAVIAPGSGTPTGTVSFYDGKTLIGTSTVTGGSAALWWSPTRLNDRPLTAVYSGDGKLFSSISAVVTQRVVSTANPRITFVHDVTSDQGRQVRTRFRASGFDWSGSGTPIVRYDVFRQVNPLLTSMRPADGSTSIVEPGAGRNGTLRALGMGAPAEARAVTGPARVLVDGWDYVGSTNAFADSAYDVIVPTVADSNGSGLHRSVFFVRAVTANGSVYYDSPADSGYSVDNIAPVSPSPFTAAYQSGATNLHWGPNSEPDLWYYRVYRGSSSGFTPGPGNLIATRSDTGYADVGPPGSYYKLSATDRNGNESLFATLGPNNTLDVDDAGPIAFALDAVRPNPTRGRNLTIQFALPSDVPARLELLDVSGRRIIGRDVGALGPGRHAVELGADRAVPPGLYLVRLTQGASQRITRVTVLE